MRAILPLIFLLAASLSVNASPLVPLSAEDLLPKPQVSSIKLSPSGGRLLAVTHIDDDDSLSILDTETMSVSMRVDLDSFRNARIQWLTDDLIALTFDSYRNGTQTAVFRLLEDEAEYELVMNFFVGTVMHASAEDDFFVFHRMPERGKHNVYGFTSAQLETGNLSSGTLFLEERRSRFPPVYDASSGSVLFVAIESATEVRFESFSLIDGSRSTATIDATETKAVFPVSMESANNWIVISDEETSRKALQYFNPETNELGEVIFESTQFDVANANFGPNNNLISVDYVDGGVTYTQYFNQGTQSVQRIVENAFPNAAVSIIDTSIERDRVLMLIEASDLPPRYYLFNEATNVLEPLYSKYPEFDESALGTTSVISATSTDGVEVEGFLSEPKGQQSLGLIVMPHGGPIGVADNNLFQPRVQYFASRGFSVLRVNFRGSEGYGREFREQGRGELGQLIEDDILAVLSKALEINDYEHICAMGGSYGAYSSMMLSIRRPDLLDCAVGTFGIYDLPMALSLSNRHQNEHTQKAIREVLGDYDTEELMERSPVYLADRIQVPVLLIAGKRDVITPVDHTVRFDTMLRHFDKPVESYVYQQAGHGHSNLADHRHQLALAYDFIMRSMGHPLPNASEISDDARAVLAEDYLSLGKRTADQDRVKTVEETPPFDLLSYFLTEAVGYGASEANFLLGESLLDTDGEEFNAELGFELLESAARSGSWEARRDLGLHLLRGTFIDQNIGRAERLIYDAYTRGEEVPHSLPMAEFYCAAPEPFQNISTCIEHLKRRGESRQWVNTDFRRTVGRIYEQLPADSEVIPRVRDHIGSEARVETDRTVISDPQFGLAVYEYQRSVGGSREFDWVASPNSFSLSENLGKHMGISVVPDRPGSYDAGARLALVMIWRYPDRFGNQRSTADLFWGKNTDFTYTRELKEDQAIGDYEIEVRNLDNETLFSYRYSITP